MKRIICLCVLCCIVSAPLMAGSERSLPGKPEVKKLKIRFNGDYLKAPYLLLDARSDEEKAANMEEGSLAGSVILFIHGHNQRPDNGYNFARKLALQSKSGIVVIPVTDTPFGKKKEWRGDKGKEVILMEITRYLLNRLSVSVEGYKPITDIPVTIDPIEKPGLEEKTVPARIAVVGWSHGSLLSRRIASSYPDSVVALAQTAPAGFDHWGENACVAPSCLLTAFNWEGARILYGIFRGEGKHVFDSTSGIVRGQAADSFRSCGSCLYGNFHIAKPFRAYKDLQECALYADNTNFPVNNVKHIAVVFGDNDSLFEYDDDGGIKNPNDVKKEEFEAFFTRYYPGAVESGCRCTLEVLPGNHIGPLVHADKWAKAVLKGIDQMKE